MFSLSGGDDGLHGNQTIMEDAFNSGNADWEITRYGGVGELAHPRMIFFGLRRRLMRPES